MKIFKIKFDSKDPTDRSISVKKGDDFGIAIQIDNQQSQGPSKLLYADQEVEANKDLIEGYNVFLLKAIKDSKISVKDIDSQVIFTLNILAKDSDVVELGGTGSGGGDSVWQANDADYYIDGVLSVNNCQKITITGENDQVILKGNNNNASYEIACGDLKLNTAANIRIHPTGSTTPKISLEGNSPYIAFDCTYLNLAYDTDFYNTNAININGSGICIDAQQGELYLNSNDTLNICAVNKVCVDAGERYSTFVSGKQVIDSTFNSNTVINQFGNCEMPTDMFGRYYRVYSSALGMIIDAYNNDKVIFGSSYKNNDIVGNNVTLSATEYSETGAININGSSIKFDAQPCGGCTTTVYLNGGYCGAAHNYNVKFVLPNNLEFYGTCTCSTMPQLYYARSKVFLTLLSALETTYHNSCANDDKNYNVSQVDINVYNKLTSLFAI